VRACARGSSTRSPRRPSANRERYRLPRLSGLPASICLVAERPGGARHTGGREAARGDIISVDIGAIIDGYYGDSARTFPVGR